MLCGLKAQHLLTQKDMNIDKKTPYGGIDISLEAIASVAGKAAIECYGVVGLAPKSTIHDAISVILKSEEFAKGVYVRKDKKKKYEIDVYIYCAFGVKLTEIASEVQKRVRYELEKAFDIPLSSVNVFVQDIKEGK